MPCKIMRAEHTTSHVHFLDSREKINAFEYQGTCISFLLLCKDPTPYVSLCKKT